MSNLVKIGYISGPFGLKGQMKVISHENYQDRIFKIGNALVIKDQTYTIKTSKLIKNHFIISFTNYEDINLINDIIHHDVFINRDDIPLNENEYLYFELFGFKIIDTNEEIGIVKEILLNKQNAFIKCNDLIIPLIEKYLEKVDLKAKTIYVKNSKELII